MVDRPRTKNVEALKQRLNTNNFLFLIGFSFSFLFSIINFDNFEQTNVFANAQKRKVRPFEGMQRKAIVIVPSEEDYKARTEAQEKAECKDVPDNAVMEMKGIIWRPKAKNFKFYEKKVKFKIFLKSSFWNSNY